MVIDLVTGKSRRLLQGHPSVLPVADPIRWDQGKASAGSFSLFVGVDGIALDKESECSYFAPLSGYKMYRVRMQDLVDKSLSAAALGGRVETYADKPFNGGLSIDAKNNLYLTEVGERAIGIIPADTRKYRRYVQHAEMVWPDGVTYNSDGFMYTGAAQLPLTRVTQGGTRPLRPLGGGKGRDAGRRRGQEQGALSGLPLSPCGGRNAGLG